MKKIITTLISSLLPLVFLLACSMVFKNEKLATITNAAFLSGIISIFASILSEALLKKTNNEAATAVVFLGMSIRFISVIALYFMAKNFMEPDAVKTFILSFVACLVFSHLIDSAFTTLNLWKDDQTKEGTGNKSDE